MVQRDAPVARLKERAEGERLVISLGAEDDGATVDQLKMAHLGVPLLEAERVVQELIDLVRPVAD